MTQAPPKENKMGYMPIPKLLFEMSLPIIISMLVQALYNIVDSAFVAQLNENALTAVSLTFPVQNLMISIAVGTGVGINALLSKNLGQKNFKDANLAAKNGIFLSICSFIVFAVLGTSLATYFFDLQTQDPQIREYGIQYMTIISLCSFGVFMQITMERLLQATGRSVYSMFTQGVGAIINIILDPILIFGLFGFPRLEVAGAAIATVFGQTVGMLLGLYLNVRKNPEINLNMRHYRPNLRIIKEIYEVGIPSIVMQAISSVMTFGLNKVLLMFTPTATAVFGVYFKLQSFVFMPVLGLTNGMIPIIAFNYGARNKKRIMSTIRLSIYTAVVIMLIGLLCLEVFPAQLLTIFNASPDMMAIGIPALRIISLSFIFAGFCIIIGSVFQALGNGMYSLIISIARQLVVILPVAYIFALLFGLSSVWWAIPIAEIVSVILSALLFKRIYKKKIKGLQGQI